MPTNPEEERAAIERARCLAELAVALTRAEQQVKALDRHENAALIGELCQRIAAARRELDWLRMNRSPAPAEETSPFWRKFLPPMDPGDAIAP